MKIRNLKNCCFFIIFTLLLTGCAVAKQENPQTSDKLTIEPYSLSEKESMLVSKTGVGEIEFYKLNGTLKVNDVLQFSVVLFKNGKFKQELLKNWDEPKTAFKDSLISFGISDIRDEDHSLKLIMGIPSGLSTLNYSINMTTSSFSKLVGEKVTLEKNKPVYLAVWIGTTKNELHSVGSENGELPKGIEEAETALLYKVLWTDN